jgi:hypothetical protein
VATTSVAAGGRDRKTQQKNPFISKNTALESESRVFLFFNIFLFPLIHDIGPHFILVNCRNFKRNTAHLTFNRMPNIDIGIWG